MAAARPRSRSGAAKTEAVAETTETARSETPSAAGEATSTSGGPSRSARRRQRRRRAANGRVTAPSTSDGATRETPPAPARAPEPATPPQQEGAHERKGLLGRLLGRH